MYIFCYKKVSPYFPNFYKKKLTGINADKMAGGHYQEDPRKEDGDNSDT